MSGRGYILWMTLGLALGSAAMATGDVAGEPEAEQDFWFPVGEALEYNILWGVVPVARSTATTQWVERDGRRLLSIQFRTKSNAFLSKIYPVDDFLESVIDPDTFLPVEFTKRLNEGRYTCDETTTFDHANRRAVWRDNEKGKEKEFEIAEDTRDLISFMYFMRAEDLTVGENHDYQVMADEKIYDLTVKARKREPVELEQYGKVESVLIEPLAAFQGLFVRKGKMTMWVADDERRILTQARISVPVANVHIKLHEVTGPGDDFWLEPQEPRRRGPGRARRSRS